MRYSIVISWSTVSIAIFLVDSFLVVPAPLIKPAPSILFIPSPSKSSSGVQFQRLYGSTSSSSSSSSDSSKENVKIINEPTNANSNFGRQTFWNDLYEKQSNFSWYATWDDLQPFINEFLRLLARPYESKILVPGVGNDAIVVDMFDDGYPYITAMDYAPEGIERCREMLGPTRLRAEQGNTKDENKDHNQPGGVELVVADARDLTDTFENDAFDVVFEKGTLDAIFLSGGDDKDKSSENLNLAISELGRCLKPGGMWISVAAVVVDQIQDAFDSRETWDCLVGKDDFFVTDDGYTSNNIDGNLMVWRKEDNS